MPKCPPNQPDPLKPRYSTFVPEETLMSFSPDLFMSGANSAYLYSDGSQRYGQFLMNYLQQKHPDIKVPDSADCFHDDKNVKKFLHFIYSL